MEEKISFEENMKKLEEIATELEKGDLDLDTSVSKFEEGMKISKQCSEMLEKAETIAKEIKKRKLDKNTIGEEKEY